MEIKTEKKEKFTLYTLSGDLLGEKDGMDMVNAVSKEIESGEKNIVIEASNLRYVNSSGIGLLITLMTKLKNNNGELFIVNPTEHINKLFQITKLNSVFNIKDSIQEVESEL